jgi:hypothetical protein
MPTFTHPSPTPIDVAINWQVGAIEVFATDRTDTVVTVGPTHSRKAIDRRGAEETKVDFDGKRMAISGPKPKLTWIGPTESVDLKVELPAGSRLTVELAMGGTRTEGRLGATRIKSSMGAVELDAVGDLWLRAGHGNVTIGTAEGAVEITADHGQIRVGSIADDALFKASHGSIRIGKSGGDVVANLSYGDLEIEQALGSVTTKTAYGVIELSEVVSGSIQVESGYGNITVGVRRGIPAWLDLSSKDGRVRNELDIDRAPDPSEQTVAVRARTQASDITIRHAN